MNPRNLLIAFGLVVGISLLIFHKQVVDLFTSKSESRVALAVLSKAEGQVEVRDLQQNVRELTESSSIHDQETLMVTGGNAIRIKFNDGMEVELDPGTMAYFENSDRGIYVTLRSGQYRGVARGAGKERVLFVKDGVVMDPLGRNIWQAPIKIDETPEPVRPTAEAPPSEETLTDTQISNTMATLRNPLLKCYASNLKNNTSAKGEVYLSFTIEKNGSVSQVRILQDSFKDEQILKCITDVVERGRFDPFKGDPIVVNYPIYFE